MGLLLQREQKEPSKENLDAKRALNASSDTTKNILILVCVQLSVIVIDVAK